MYSRQSSLRGSQTQGTSHTHPGIRDRTAPVNGVVQWGNPRVLKREKEGSGDEVCSFVVTLTFSVICLLKEGKLKASPAHHTSKVVLFATNQSQQSRDSKPSLGAKNLVVGTGKRRTKAHPNRPQRPSAEKRVSASTLGKPSFLFLLNSDCDRDSRRCRVGLVHFACLLSVKVLKVCASWFVARRMSTTCFP